MTNRVFDQLLGWLLVDKAAAARAAHCGREAGECPMDVPVQAIFAERFGKPAGSRKAEQLSNGEYL
jgi:hypothetical protein